jgi:hypothetical protein
MTSFCPIFLPVFIDARAKKLVLGKIWRYLQKWKEVADRLKEEMSPFFSAVAELAVSRGFEVADVNEGALTLNLNGEFAAMVDETGAMNYHPYKEVFDMMDEVLKIRAEIPDDNPEEGMQLNM